MIEIVIEECITCDDCGEIIRLDEAVDGLLCIDCNCDRYEARAETAEVRAKAAERQLAEALEQAAKRRRVGLVPAELMPPAMLLDAASRVVRAHGSYEWESELRRYAVAILGWEERHNGN